MTKTPTLADVAALAGVSTSAVSRTFTPGASASKETRRRVLAAANELGYRPNAIARTLSTRKSHIIALVVSYLENQFYPVVIETLAQQLQASGYQLLLFISDDLGNDTDDLLLNILQYQVDGIVMASTKLSSKLANRCQAAGIPVVLFNRTSRAADVSTVASDNIEGGRLAARLLLERGARRISYIAGLDDSSTSQEREAGMLAELEAQGVKPFRRVNGDYHVKLAAEATRQLFAPGREHPDGLFVANDHMAFAAMDVLRGELALRIPDDVQVVGFDDVPQARWGGYQLTTISQDADAMVTATVDTLLKQMSTPSPVSPTHVITPVAVIERSTTLSPKR